MRTIEVTEVFQIRCAYSVIVFDSEADDVVFADMHVRGLPEMEALQAKLQDEWSVSDENVWWL